MAQNEEKYCFFAKSAFKVAKNLKKISYCANLRFQQCESPVFTPQQNKHNTSARAGQSAKVPIFWQKLCRICQLLYFLKNVIIKAAQERPVRKGHRQCKETDEAEKSKSKGKVTVGIERKEKPNKP